MEFSLHHTCRENNGIADFLANIGCKEKRKSFIFCIFSYCSLMPRKVRGMIRIDRLLIFDVRDVLLILLVITSGGFPP